MTEMRPVASNTMEFGDPNVREIFPACPICGGKFEVVYDRAHQTVCVCQDCHLGLTIPASAWRIARQKLERRSAERTAAGTDAQG